MKLVSFIKKAFLIPACLVLAAIVPATVQGACDSFKYSPSHTARLSGRLHVLHWH